MRNLLTHLLLWLPVASCALFGAVVKLDHHLYGAGKINVQGAAGIELLYLALCAITFLASAATAAQLWKDGKPWAIACSAVSIVVGLLLLGRGFQQGAALLYTT